ncbi:MAG: hypothetical protein EOP54_23290, partial [Sphingobacteriales bacterium]
LYIAEQGTSRILKISADGATQTEITSGIDFAQGLVTDNANNLYVSDFHTSTVWKFPVDGSPKVAIATGITSVGGIDMDAEGNIYAVSRGDKTLVKIPADMVSPPAVITTFANEPYDVAIDANGNLYVTTLGVSASQITKIPAGSNTTELFGPVFNGATGVKTDPVGNVYVTDPNLAVLRKISPDGNTIASVSVPNGAGDIALDKSGNVYVGEANVNLVKKFALAGGYYLSDALPPGLNFDSETGIISGTPTKATAAKDYNIIAYNTLGGTQVNLNIRIVGSNTDLADLTISQGTLSPAFSAGELNYTVNVGSGATLLTITPTVSGADATVTVNDVAVTSGSPSADLNLDLGDNIFTVKVTAENNDTKEYIITVSKTLSNNSRLANLIPTEGTLVPDFDPEIMDYAITVGVD